MPKRDELKHPILIQTFLSSACRNSSRQLRYLLSFLQYLGLPEWMEASSHSKLPSHFGHHYLNLHYHCTQKFQPNAIRMFTFVFCCLNSYQSESDVLTKSQFHHYYIQHFIISSLLTHFRIIKKRFLVFSLQGLL